VAEGGHYDIVILGGGSGGYACALRAAELGKRVALIEKDKVGGTCLHRGCIPTKALLHAAEVADSTRESAKFGVRAAFEGIDMPQVLSYQQGVVERLWKGLQSTLASRKIDTIIGDGRLTSPNSVAVGDDVYTGDYVVLATGSVPRSLPGLTLDGQRVISSDEGLALDRVPASAIILGGGVIGVEFASVWRSFGADVTIVEMAPQLLEWSHRMVAMYQFGVTREVEDAAAAAARDFAQFLREYIARRRGDPGERQGPPPGRPDRLREPVRAEGSRPAGHPLPVRQRQLAGVGA